MKKIIRFFLFIIDYEEILEYKHMLIKWKFFINITNIFIFPFSLIPNYITFY